MPTKSSLITIEVPKNAAQLNDVPKSVFNDCEDVFVLSN